MQILKYVPGFRSGQTWKKIVASIFYIFAIFSWIANGFCSFLVMIGMLFLACSIVDLILHGLRNKKDTPIKQSIILLIVAFALMITGGGLESSKNVAEAETLYSQAEAYIDEGKIDEALKAIDSSKQLNPDKKQNKAFWLEEKIQKLNSDDFMKETLVNMSDDDFNLLKNGDLKAKFIGHEKLNSIFLNKLTENSNKREEYLAEIAEQQRIAEEKAEEKRQEEAKKERLAKEEAEKKRQKEVEKERLAKEEAEKKRQDEAEKERLAKEEAEKKKQEEAAAERKEMIKKQFSAWDGAHRNLTRLIQEGMHDPNSFDHVETVYWDMGDHLVVQTTFRGKNALKNVVKAKVSLDGDVLEIIDQY